MPVSKNKSLSFKEMTISDFNRLSSYIYNNYGIKMPVGKKTMLQCRLQKRMRELKILSYKEYCDFVFSKHGQEDEIYQMIDVVSTNKTDFFREPAHFDFLKNTILPELNKNDSSKSFVKVWSAGCASGEEAYTIAMVMSEFKENNPDFDFKILGTDISNQILSKAVNAIYPLNKVSDIPLNLKKKYLLKSKDKTLAKVRIVPDLRAKVKFVRLNLIEENYNVQEKYDIIFCRNTLIYFDKETQEKVVFKLINELKNNGYFILGHSESLINMDTPLKQVRPTVYRKI